jgi:hypothetical protein
MLTSRYEIQYVDLKEIVRKSEVKWVAIGRRRRLDTAKKYMEEFVRSNIPNYLYRVVDRKTGRPVA